MYFDGSLKLKGTGAGVLLISPTGEQLKYVLQIFWKVSKNKDEYKALLHGLLLAASLGIKRLLVYGDSAVVINHVNKSWDCNKENMDAYCLAACSFGWWLVLICCERKVLLAGCWWLVCSERKLLLAGG
jgi:ribonuclease HI